MSDTFAFRNQYYPGITIYLNGSVMVDGRVSAYDVERTQLLSEALRRACDSGWILHQVERPPVLNLHDPIESHGPVRGTVYAKTEKENEIDVVWSGDGLCVDHVPSVHGFGQLGAGTEEVNGLRGDCPSPLHRVAPTTSHNARRLP